MTSASLCRLQELCNTGWIAPHIRRIKLCTMTIYVHGQANETDKDDKIPPHDYLPDSLVERPACEAFRASFEGLRRANNMNATVEYQPKFSLSYAESAKYRRRYKDSLKCRHSPSVQKLVVNSLIASTYQPTELHLLVDGIFCSFASTQPDLDVLRICASVEKITIESTGTSYRKAMYGYPAAIDCEDERFAASLLIQLLRCATNLRYLVMKRLSRGCFNAILRNAPKHCLMKIDFIRNPDFNWPLPRFDRIDYPLLPKIRINPDTPGYEGLYWNWNGGRFSSFHINTGPILSLLRDACTRYRQGIQDLEQVLDANSQAGSMTREELRTLRTDIQGCLLSMDEVHINLASGTNSYINGERSAWFIPHQP